MGGRAEDPYPLKRASDFKTCLHCTHGLHGDLVQLYQPDTWILVPCGSTGPRGWSQSASSPNRRDVYRYPGCSTAVAMALTTDSGSQVEVANSVSCGVDRVSDSCAWLASESARHQPYSQLKPLKPSDCGEKNEGPR